jgi:hypothetical protein
MNSMTILTSNYLEYYLTLVSWIIFDGLWRVITNSGLFAMVFFAIILEEWLKGRAQGVDEGNKGVQSMLHMENRVYVAIVVVLAAVAPVFPVTLQTMQYDETRSNSCQISAPQAASEDNGWRQSFTSLNGQTAQVPLWWVFMHSVSRAITGAAIQAIPCGTDLRQLRTDFNYINLNDSLLAQELADFSRECYGRANAKLFQNRPTLTKEQMEDVSWPGSRFFIETPGYYDYYHAQTPRTNWPYDVTRDATLPEVSGGGGYPTCLQWWTGASASVADAGLRTRLLALVAPTTLDRFKTWAGWMTATQAEDAAVRAISRPTRQNVNKGAAYADYGGAVDKTLSNGVNRAVSDVGATIGAAFFFPMMDVVRQALPMVFAFLKMGLVICLPLVLLIGTYSLAVVVKISVIQFALFFVEFWFELARWVDSTILDALYGSGSPHTNMNPLMGLDNAFGDMILNMVMGSMFLLLPAFWMAALSWAGVSVGNALQKGFTEGTQAAGQSASKGVETVKGGAMKGL